MKRTKKSNRGRKNEQPQSSARGRTNLPGQNPRANDDPSHDENNDENRRP